MRQPLWPGGLATGFLLLALRDRALPALRNLIRAKAPRTASLRSKDEGDCNKKNVEKQFLLLSIRGRREANSPGRRPPEGRKPGQSFLLSLLRVCPSWSFPSAASPSGFSPGASLPVRGDVFFTRRFPWSTELTRRARVSKKGQFVCLVFT